MREWVVGQVLRFIEEGHLWQAGELDSLLDRLRTNAPGEGEFAPRLADAFTPLVDRRSGGTMSLRLQVDLEAVIYPRLWKIVEGVQTDVMDGELYNRIDGLRRGLARVLDEEFETDGGSDAGPTRIGSGDGNSGAGASLQSS